MTKSTKELLTGRLESNLQSMTPDKSNSGRFLWPVFYWQVTSEYADKAFKEAWKAATEASIFEEDDKLRKLGAGEHLIADSNHFSALVSVSKPRNNFDRDLFIQKVAKKYKLPKDKLEEMAEACKIPGNPSLTKRVVEAV